MEEEAFPRGGAETRRRKGRKALVVGEGDLKTHLLLSPSDEDSEEDFQDDGEEKGKGKRRKNERQEEKSVWTKRLRRELCVPGVLALACIRRITDTEVKLEFSNGIKARLAPSDISDHVVASISEGVVSSLQDIFTLGQLLPCKVILEKERDGIKSRKQTKSHVDDVQVTTNPREVNNSLVLNNLQPGLTLVCAVKSKEDKGYQMDVGVPALRGFMSTTEVDSRMETLLPGTVLMCKILSVSSSMVARLTCRKESLEATDTVVEGEGKPTRDQLLPGMILSGNIQDTSERGVLVDLDTDTPHLQAWIPARALPYPFSSNPEKLLSSTVAFGEDGSLRVVVTFTQPNTALLGVSAAPHLLRLASSAERLQVGDLSVGSLVEDATVTWVRDGPRPSVSFSVRKGIDGIAVHPNVEFPKELETKDLGKGVFKSIYPLGSTHKCRVLGFGIMDRIVHLSNIRQVLKQKIVAVAEAEPGMLLKSVKVDNVTANGIFITIYDHIKGFIPKIHSADRPLLNLEKVVKIGQKMKCRVLYVNTERNQVVLTRKGTLVDSDLPIITCCDPELVGSVSHGTVVSLQAHGALICFYNNVCGWLRRQEWESAGINKVTEGQPIAVKILSVDVEASRMQLGMAESVGDRMNHKVNTESSSLEIGTVVTGTVEEKASDGLWLRVSLDEDTEDCVRVFLPKEHMTDCVGEEIVNALLRLAQVGDEWKVTLIGHKMGRTNVSAKPILLRVASSGNGCIRCFEELEVGQFLFGYIGNRHPDLGYFVELPGRLSGLVPFSATDVGVELVPGQSVLTRITKVDDTRKRFSATLKTDVCSSRKSGFDIDFPSHLLREALHDLELLRIGAAKSQNRRLQVISEFTIGQKVEVTVDSSGDSGIICSMKSIPGIKGIVTPENVEPDSNLEKGTTLEAVIIYVDYASDCLELSLKTQLIGKGKKKKKNKVQGVDSVQGVFLLEKPDFSLAYLPLEDKFLFFPTRIHPNQPQRPDQINRRHDYSIGQCLTLTLMGVYGNSSQMGIPSEWMRRMEEETKDTGRTPPSDVWKKEKKRLEFGQVYTAIVPPHQEDKTTFIELAFPGTAQRGRLHISELVDDATVGSLPMVDLHRHLDSLPTNSNNDKEIKVKIIGFTSRLMGSSGALERSLVDSSGKSKTIMVSRGNRYAECSMRASKMAQKRNKKTVLGYKLTFNPDQEVTGFVTHVTNTKVEVAVNPHWNGWIDELETCADLNVVQEGSLRSRFRVGQAVKTRVLGEREGIKNFLRLSLLHAADGKVTNGKPCLGLISRKFGLEEGGQIVFDLPGGSEGSMELTDLVDDYSDSFKTHANLKEGMVRQVLPLSHQDGKESKKWLLSLRDSLLTAKKSPESPKKKGKKSKTTAVPTCVDPFFSDISGLSNGVVLRGFVKKRMDHGFLVQLGPGRLAGWLPHRQILSKLTLTTGDLVKVTLLSINVDSGKIELDLVDTVADINSQKRNLRTVKRERVDSQSSISSVPDPLLRKKIRKSLKSENDVISTDAAVPVPKFADIVAVVPSVDKGSATQIPEAGGESTSAVQVTAGGFNWNPDEFSAQNLVQVALGEKMDETCENQQLDAKMGSGDEDLVEGEKPKKLGSFQREKLDEQKLFQKELSLMDPERRFETPEDFDRALVGSPNSSLLWLRYMAYHMGNDDVDKAREIGAKALKAIRQEDSEERFNIWTALLNLEAQKGTEDSLRSVFNVAYRANDAFRTYKQFCKILKNAEKTEMLEEVLEEMLKKWRSEEVEVWVMKAEHLMHTHRHDSAREHMHRALKSLPNHQHVFLLMRFAQMEFSVSGGDKERGKTLFESILSSYPKRTDVWSVYIDMVLKYCTLQEARAILERVTGLRLGAHKMRFFFKKWLTMEEKYGTNKSQHGVKEKAAAYVKSVEDILL